MNIKKMLAAILVCTMLASLAGCSDGSDKDSSESGASAVSSAESSSEPEKIPETDEEWNDAMLKKAMVSYGNTSMMQNVIKKAQSGEEVTLAYLGGSITEGISAGPDDCYAKLSYDHFAETFGTGDNVKFCNAGLSGTPSKLGILRLDRDVLSSDPDVVFIEFAVNDGNDPDHQNAYESIVQTLLKKNIAVVLLFSVTAEDYSAQDYMKEIGAAYNLPMISYCDALRYLFENNRLTWEEFSDDQSHPNKEGHKLVASMINYYFDTVMDQEPMGDYILPPENVYSPREVNAHMVENDGITPISLGSWTEGTDVASFDKGWHHSPDAGNEPIVFEMDASFLYMIYKEAKTGNYGKLHVKVTADGEDYDECDYEVLSPSGWGNAQVQNIAMMPSTTKYHVEISMAEGDEETYAAILGFGYTE
ncbi:MAG: SGNH/GDSL hydrolase family protein [Ruminococcus sp.]|nr:SGNH/GDSL hydrolase family protein [Ruminococcus sp.]